MNVAAQPPPNYSGCLGRECRLSQPGSNSLKRCWIAHGSVTDAFEEIIPSIEDLINDHPKLQAEKPSFGLTCCLVGVTAQRVSPVIVFHCSNTKYRKTVIKLLKRKAFWRRFLILNSEFTLMEQDRAPQLVASKFLRSNVRYFSINYYAKEPWPPHLVFEDGHTHVYATAGGILNVGDCRFGLSAGHMLFSKRIRVDVQNDLKTQLTLHSDGSDEIGSAEGDIQDSGDSESTSISDMELSRQYDTTNEGQIAISSNSGRNSLDSNQEFPRVGLEKLGLGHGAIETASVDFSSGALDWAIFDLTSLMHNVSATDEEFCTKQWQHGVTTIADEDQTVEDGKAVKVRTSSRVPIDGVLRSSRYRYRAEGANCFIWTHVLELSQDLFPGDCGSWVVDDVGCWYGHVIAYQTQDRTAYVVPASALVRDIAEKTGQEVTLFQPQTSQFTQPQTLPDLGTDVPVPLPPRSRITPSRQNRNISKCNRCRVLHLYCDGKDVCGECRRGTPWHPCGPKTSRLTSLLRTEGLQPPSPTLSTASSAKQSSVFSQPHDQATEGSVGSLSPPLDPTQTIGKSFDGGQEGAKQAFTHNQAPEKPLRSPLNDETIPRGYAVRPLEWFKPGRMFSIWDPSNKERHLKEYVLLDTRNIDGTCLMVESQEAGHTHEEHDEADFYREHVRVRNWGYPSDLDPMEQVIFLSKFDKRNLNDDTWIHLERTYNIPFEKLACGEHSILDRASLTALRQFYLANLAYTWDLDKLLKNPA